MVDIRGSLWATTYWGRRGDVVYGDGYEGDLLLEVDSDRKVVVNHGPIAGRRGIPSMVLAADGRTLVAEANQPDRNGYLTAFDAVTRTVLSEASDSRHIGFRALGAPLDGGVLYSIGGGRLARYSPTDGGTNDLGVVMPGDWLRAATAPAPDGTIYGVTQDEPVLFALAPDGSIVILGDPRGYTTTLTMTHGGETVYWLPDAHGRAWEHGATVLALDTESGRISEVVSLRRPFEDELGLLPGGTYSISYSSGRLYLGINASPLGDDSGFGTVVLVVIEGL